MRTTDLIRAAGLTALLGSLGVAAPAQAVTTVGNNLAVAPAALDVCQGETGCTVVPLSLVLANRAPGGLTPATPGVVVRWRVKSGARTAASSIALRVVRNNTTGVAASSPQTLPVGAAQTFVFATRVSVAAGDRLGIDLITPSGVSPPIAAPGALTATWNRWEPALGSTPELHDDTQPFELLLNADIEADADADGFGDETQDGCLGTAGTQGGCPPPPPPPPPTTPPPAPTSPPPPTPGPSAPITNPPAVPPPSDTGVIPSSPVGETGSAARITGLQFTATRVRFRISESARVSLLVQRVRPGRRSGVRCVKVTPRNRRARSCVLLVRALSGRTDVAPGLNTARLRRLPAGHYRVRLFSIDTDGHTSTVIRYFRLTS